VSVEGRCRDAMGGSDTLHRSTKGKTRPSVRAKISRTQDNRTRRPRLSAVAAQLAAARDEPAAVVPAPRLGVALARKAHELSSLRRENAAPTGERGPKVQAWCLGERGRGNNGRPAQRPGIHRNRRSRSARRAERSWTSAF
jgi:hypothetical protein